MSGTYEFVQLDVFTKALLTSNPLAIFHRRTRMTSLRRDYGRRCEFSVRLFELIVDQTHRPQECVPARTMGLVDDRSEEHTSELQSPYDLVCRLLLEKKNHTRARRPMPKRPPAPTPPTRPRA